MDKDFDFDKRIRFEAVGKRDTKYDGTVIYFQLTWREAFVCIGILLLKRANWMSNVRYEFAATLLERSFEIRDFDFNYLLCTLSGVGMIELLDDDVKLTEDGWSFLSENSKTIGPDFYAKKRNAFIKMLETESE